MSFAQPPAGPAPTPGAAGAGTDGQLPPELKRALSRITEISSLPEVTARIVEVVEDPRSTAQEMREIVKHDPALAAKILKVVNSSFYGLPSQISSLDRAIVMLGLSAVKNIALAASLSRLFRPGALSQRFSARDLWNHCISVGVCARMLAQASFGQAEEAFVAGLVHDMGILLEFQVLPDKLRQVVSRCEQQPEDFCAVEREIIGADHQVFGGALAEKWKFPLGLRVAISHHHNPGNLKPELLRVVTAVQVADLICCQNELGFYLSALHRDVTDEMLDVIGLGEQRVAEILEDLGDRIEETQQIFASE